MPSQRSLKVVGAGPPSPGSRKPLTVKAAAETGSRRELLTATRARIATAIDNADTPPRDLAALTRRLLEIAKELELLAAADKVDDIGEAASTPDQKWTAT